MLSERFSLSNRVHGEVTTKPKWISEPSLGVSGRIPEVTTTIDYDYEIEIRFSRLSAPEVRATIQRLGGMFPELESLRSLVQSSSAPQMYDFRSLDDVGRAMTEGKLSTLEAKKIAELMARSGPDAFVRFNDATREFYLDNDFRLSKPEPEPRSEPEPESESFFEINLDLPL